GQMNEPRTRPEHLVQSSIQRRLDRIDADHIQRNGLQSCRPFRPRQTTGTCRPLDGPDPKTTTVRAVVIDRLRVMSTGVKSRSFHRELSPVLGPVSSLEI